MENKKSISLNDAMAKLENAYVSASTGKIKFKEVKSVFKKLHKEIKKSVKSQKNN